MIRIELDVMLARPQNDPDRTVEATRHCAAEPLHPQKRSREGNSHGAARCALPRTGLSAGRTAGVGTGRRGRKGIIIHRKKGLVSSAYTGKDQPCFCRSGMLLSGAAKKASTNTPPRGSRRKPAVRTAWAYDQQGRSAQALPEFRRVPVGKSCCGQSCSW